MANEGGSTKTDQAARDQFDQERIKELRERLYARGQNQQETVRHPLPQTTPRHDPSHQIHDELPKEPIQTIHHEPPRVSPAPVEDAVSYSEAPMTRPSKRSTFRKVALMIGGGFFVIALAVASFLLLKGGNSISGENITLAATGPLAAGGGEEYAYQVSVANQNTVAIQSATLVIEYPPGTHAVGDADKEITVERKALDTIQAGETVNVDLRARMYGKENDQKEIKVRIEYRVAGSNATFEKKAEPLQFKISTSPIVMVVDAVKKITSGQEITLTATLQANSPTPITDVLVKFTYPEGFDFSSTKPDTISGEDTWKFSKIEPNEKKTITIKGIMTGHESETKRFTAAAGVPSDENKNALGSQLTSANADVTIEQPFLDVSVSVNGMNTDPAIINVSESANVQIKFKNTLNDSLNDGKVLVELSGNALDEFRVGVNGGFYDSTKNTITWDSVDEQTLKEILPGGTTNLSFDLTPKENIGSAPEMHLLVTVKAQRIYENNVPQELIGTDKRTIKIESIPTLTSSALHTSGPFTNSGPVPPVAEKVTQYTYTLRVHGGSNAITGGEVTAVLPQYMTWLDLVSDGDTVTYIPSTRTIRWAIGDLEPNASTEVSMQVSFLPSLTQIGTTPTILETQRFKATDRFTGTVVRTEHPALTTSLYDESDEKLQDGKVRASE